MNSENPDLLPITEQENLKTTNLSSSPVREIIRLMNDEDALVASAISLVLPEVERAIEGIVARIRSGGRLFYIGTGTSGRLGVLDAAECPPTFGVSPDLVQAVIAGGRPAVFRSAEGAEDDAAEGARQIRARARGGDVVVGIAASGVTPFVRAALDMARRRRAATVLVTCNPRIPRRAARVLIALDVGPEVLAGSTRLKAGTATKLTLNSLTTAAFAGLGKVYGNRMVDLRPRSAKLRARAIRLVREIGRVGETEAARLLRSAQGSAKLAIVMARLAVGSKEARRMLKEAAGSLRTLLEEGDPRASGPSSRG